MLAALSPEDVPFMADESVIAIPGIQVIRYDMNCYLQFAQGVKTALKGLQEKGSYY